MFLPSTIKILLSKTPVDMRKSINGLSMLVSDVFGKNPISNYLFVFRNKRGDKLKILYWDRNGFCLWYKRLEKGRFKLPKPVDGQLEMSLQKLQWLLDGLDFMTLEGSPSLHYDRYF